MLNEVKEVSDASPFTQYGKLVNPTHKSTSKLTITQERDDRNELQYIGHHPPISTPRPSFSRI